MVGEKGVHTKEHNRKKRGFTNPRLNDPACIFSFFNHTALTLEMLPLTAPLLLPTPSFFLVERRSEVEGLRGEGRTETGINSNPTRVSRACAEI